MAAPQPKSDAYTGMLIISLVAMLIGCALLYLDYGRYPSSPPAKPQPAARITLEPEKKQAQ
jgi:hypothetical protein